MKGWRGIVAAGVMCLSTIVSNAQEYDTLNRQKSNNPIPDVLEWDYSNLDSAKMADIKKKVYPLKKNKPTKAGVDMYVPDNRESVIYDYQKFFKVPIYTMEFETDSLSLYTENENDQKSTVTVINVPTSNVVDELGVHWSNQHYATITDEDQYLGYSLKTTKKSILWNIISANKFVRSVMLHELGHEYIDQIIAELHSERYMVDRNYSTKYMGSANSLFIEEGIAEYGPIAMGETIQGEKRIPESINDMFERSEKYNFYYGYSVYFLQDFLKSKGLHEGVRILLTNPPPTNEEIFKPEMYFSRLKPLQKIPEEEYK